MMTEHQRAQVHIQQQQQQQQQQQHLNHVATTTTSTATTVDDEYMNAQRAAVEAIQIGRSTLEVTNQQSEQLYHMEQMVDETQYKLDKAHRILRGMTWTGWITNKLTKDIVQPTNQSGQQQQQQKERRDPPLLYDIDTYPSNTRSVIQALQNYHANVNVLLECDTEEQKQTCILICDTMYKVAHETVNQFYQSTITTPTNHQNQNTQKQVVVQKVGTQEQQPSSSSSSSSLSLSSIFPLNSFMGGRNSMESYALEFALDLKTLRERQLINQTRIRGLDQLLEKHMNVNNNNNNNNLTFNSNSSSFHNSQHDEEKQELFSSIASSSTTTTNTNKSMQQRPPPSNSVVRSMDHNSFDPAVHHIIEKQDEHLNMIGTTLNELQYIATTLSTEVSKHHEIITSIETKSDLVFDQTRNVTRRTNQMIHQHSYFKPKGTSTNYRLSIRHVKTGTYLSIDPQNPTTMTLLVNQCHPITGTFVLYSKQTAGSSSKSSQTQSTSTIVGLQNQATKKFLGLSMLFGQLTCSSTTLNQREEMEFDVNGTPVSPNELFDITDNNNDSNDTSHLNRSRVVRILVSSANWGNGGYVIVYPNSNTLGISGTNNLGTEHQQRNDDLLWCVSLISSS